MNGYGKIACLNKYVALNGIGEMAMKVKKKVITFEMGRYLFGIDIQQIKSMEPTENIIKTLRVPDYIKGFIQFDQKPTPIVDLKERLLNRKTKPSKHSRIFIVNLKDVHVGIFVDSASNIFELNESTIKPYPKLTTFKISLVQGIGKIRDRQILILDLRNIFSSEETNQIKQIVNGFTN